MIIELDRAEYISHNKLARFLAFFGLRYLILRFLIVTDKSRISEHCLCEKCNTTFKGSYGVGYYSCENKSRLEFL